MIELPAPPSLPEVSVVLVTFNAWEWTERALQALAEHTDPVYETIVIDNLSTDATRERLGALANARVVLNERNHGFGAAASQGALLAQAPRLVFLNTDALVTPGWLPPLLQTLDGSDDVAAVTPRLLHLDGSLQEAGSMVWGDGACDNFGDGDDPERPEYRFRRDVDYASAACLLVRRSAFVEAGGFDDAYHPAYYEDVDLAMRWRATGLRVVYEPRSTAVHRRWASSGDRSGMVELLLRNRATFLARWRDEIGDRPPRPPEPRRADLMATRDAACGERVLVLAGAGGVTGAVADTATVLAERPWWRVTLLVGGDADSAEAERRRGAGVEVVGGDAAAALLADRRRHYTAVLVADGTPRALLDAVAATQRGVFTLRLDAGEEPAACALRLSRRLGPADSAWYLPT